MSHTFEGHIILLPWFQFYPLQNLCRVHRESQDRWSGSTGILTVASAFGQCCPNKIEQKVFQNFNPLPVEHLLNVFIFHFFSRPKSCALNFQWELWGQIMNPRSSRGREWQKSPSWTQLLRFLTYKALHNENLQQCIGLFYCILKARGSSSGFFCKILGDRLMMH